MPAEEGNDALCPACYTAWENDTLETCGVCAKPVPKCVCMTPVMLKANCQGFCKTVYYDPKRRTSAQNRLIYHIKKRENDNALRFLASSVKDSLLEMLDEAGIGREDVILTYLPRTRNARLLYGTDQALALCRALSSLTNIEYRALLCRKRGREREQKRLSPAKRFQNAKQSILPLPQGDCKGKTVVLIDDIVTTGASLSAGVRILRRMGAKQVFCAAIATDVTNKDSAVH